MVYRAFKDLKWKSCRSSAKRLTADNRGSCSVRTENRLDLKMGKGQLLK